MTKLRASTTSETIQYRYGVTRAHVCASPPLTPVYSAGKLWRPRWSCCPSWASPTCCSLSTLARTRSPRSSSYISTPFWSPFRCVCRLLVRNQRAKLSLLTRSLLFFAGLLRLCVLLLPEQRGKHNSSSPSPPLPAQPGCFVASLDWAIKLQAFVFRAQLGLVVFQHKWQGFLRFMTVSALIWFRGEMRCETISE